MPIRWENQLIGIGAFFMGLTVVPDFVYDEAC